MVFQIQFCMGTFQSEIYKQFCKPIMHHLALLTNLSCLCLLSFPIYSLSPYWIFILAHLIEGDKTIK